MVLVVVLCGRLGSFFFSSRRRHTRYIGDWSSDVCSSDLPSAAPNPATRNVDLMAMEIVALGSITPELWAMVKDEEHTRSEERRVGKECKSRGARDDGRKKIKRKAGREGEDIMQEQETAQA